MVLIVHKLITELLTIQDILHKYGFHESRTGFILCPFHSEKTPSAKAYKGNQRFHCFGCGADHDAIGFVMAFFQLDFRQAEIKINNDFNLNLTKTKPTYRDRIKTREMQKRREAAAARTEKGEQIYLKLCEVRRDVAAMFGEDIPEIIYLDGILEEYLSNPTPLSYWEGCLKSLELILKECLLSGNP